MSQIRKLIRAYHGSPYDFDKFDASRIGTGEGAQAYGHGLYFAGSEPVADVYRSAVSALKRTPLEDARELWRKAADRSGNKQKAVLDALDHAEESLGEAAGIPQAEQRWREIIQHLYELDFRQPLPNRPGRMYEVDIDVPEASLLDWDAQLDSQSPVVQDALSRLGAWPEMPPGMPYGPAGEHAYRAAGMISGLEEKPGWGSVLNTINDFVTDQALAARRMLGAGIPGIRYLDQGSRVTGSGTHNYVMFPGTEGAIRILRKYGLLAPIAAGSAAATSEAGDTAMTPEGIDLLTPEELEELRAEFPDDWAAEGLRQLEQAAGFVSGNIEADNIQFSTEAPRSRIEVAGDRRLPDWNTGDSRARQRLDNYYSAVTDAMQQPVISVRAAAEQAAMRLGLPEEVFGVAVQKFEQGMADSYPDGFMSPSDFLREINVQPYLLQAEVGGLPDKIVQAQLAMIEEGAARQAQAVADQIGQKTYDPNVEAAVGLIRQAVVDHAPKGRYAAYGHRTAAENAAVANAPFVEDAKYRMTKDGAQNHRALRVAELFSAGDEGYAPGTGFSQFARGVGGTFGPMINRVRGVSDTIDRRNAEGTAWDDMREIGGTYGNFGYAANLYNAAGQGDPQDVYAPDGTAKYYNYDPTNVMGLGQSMLNTSFPMARMYNATAPVREAALHLGNETIPDLAANLRRLRNEYRAITPVIPDGMNPEEHRAMGQRLDEADTRMEGYMSAAYGPKFADAYNAATGENADRTYMSPAFSTLLSIPGEAMSDPINLGFNLAVPGVGGAVVGGARGNLIGGLKGMATGAAKGAAKGVATAPTRMIDDTVEEMVENNVIGPTTMGFGDFFRPERDNLLMDGWVVQDKGGVRQGTPNDKGYDEEVESRHLDARQAQYETADAYGKAREKAKNAEMDRVENRRGVASVRFGDEQPTRAGDALQEIVSRPQSKEEREYEEWRKQQGQPVNRSRRPVAEVRW